MTGAYADVMFSGMADPSTAAPYRDAGRASRLAPPPRRVPVRLSLLLGFGGPLAAAGWLCLAVGSVLAWSFGASTDLSRFTVHGPRDRVEGVVTHTELRDRDKNRLYETHFVFDDASGRHLGTSYSNDTQLPDGYAVTLEVPRGRPDQAVIVGMRRAPLPLWVGLLVLLFPLIGAGLAGYRWVRGRRERALLARGLLGHGRLVHRETTRVHVNEQPVIKLSFDFEDERGRVHRVVVRTLRPEKVTDEALEPLVYDPAAPASAALLDALPGTPHIDAAGQLVFDGSPWTLLTALGLPLLALLANVIAAAVVASM